MSKFIILFFIFITHLFCQEQIDSLTVPKSNIGYMFGLNLMHGNYTFGIDEGSTKGSTNGFSFFIRRYNKSKTGLSLELGTYSTIQKSPRSCEYVGEIQKEFYQRIYFFTANYATYSKYYIYSFGISANNSEEESTVCSNDFSIGSPLLTYKIGIGLIEFIYADIGYRTDYPIHSNFKGNYGAYSTGLNYSFKNENTVNLSHFWNRNDSPDYDYFFSGWILESHFRLIQNFGIKSSLYYLRENRLSINFGLTYIL